MWKITPLEVKNAVLKHIKATKAPIIDTCSGEIIIKDSNIDNIINKLTKRSMQNIDYNTT